MWLAFLGSIDTIKSLRVLDLIWWENLEVWDGRLVGNTVFLQHAFLDRDKAMIPQSQILIDSRWFVGSPSHRRAFQPGRFGVVMHDEIHMDRRRSSNDWSNDAIT